MNDLPQFCAILWSVLGSWTWICGGAWAHPEVEHRIEACTAAIQDSPRDASAYLRRAACLVEKGDWPLAEADFARARKLSPASSDADRVRGECLLDAGKPVEAMAALDQALRLNSNDARALEVRARANSQLGRHRDAASDLAKAIELSPAVRADLHQRHARECIAANGKAGLSAALRSLDAAIEQMQSRPAAPLQLLAADLAAQAGDLEESARRLDALGSAMDASFTFLQRKAEILRQSGNLAGAVAAYEMALKRIEALPLSRRNAGTSKAGEAATRKALAELQAETKR